MRLHSPRGPNPVHASAHAHGPCPGWRLAPVAPRSMWGFQLSGMSRNKASIRLTFAVSQSAIFRGGSKRAVAVARKPCTNEEEMMSDKDEIDHLARTNTTPSESVRVALGRRVHRGRIRCRTTACAHGQATDCLCGRRGWLATSAESPRRTLPCFAAVPAESARYSANACLKVESVNLVAPSAPPGTPSSSTAPSSFMTIAIGGGARSPISCVGGKRCTVGTKTWF